MEFRFNLNEILKEPVVEIGNSLIPPGFSGDKRALWDTQSKITQIINAMGEASAQAQGLSKPITTADRLRNSEHKLYLLVDQSANNGKGAVTGMLKTGEKGLYVFDREGQHYQVTPPCVLDFYIHESRQRSGFGKHLFEHMLQRQQLEPVKMAIDRPSDKLLGFLNKHYGLNSPVKQMNNYVVFDGFFPRSSETPRTVEVDKSYSIGKKQSANGLQHGIPTSPYGRYAAPRPPCSMGQIIHNDSAVIKRNQEPTGVRSEPFTNVPGQQNMYSSNHIPAWQTTQSVPNIQCGYSQNSQNVYQGQQQFAQNVLNQPYLKNQQNLENQQVGNNSNFQQQLNARYPPSSGDHLVNDFVQPNQNSVCVGQSQNQNFAIGQGDASSQFNKDQNAPYSTVQQVPDHNISQIQNQQNIQGNIFNQNQAQANPQLEPGVLSQNTAQTQPQMFTYQGQNYLYNPQTQQYQMTYNQHQENLLPNLAQGQNIYDNQMPLQVNAQTSHQFAQRQPLPQPNLQHQKEPLRPQSFDGTVRKVQYSVSSPIQNTKTEQIRSLPAIVQETASAPVSYQHQQAIVNLQQNQVVEEARNAIMPQVKSQVEPVGQQLNTHINESSQFNNQMMVQNQFQDQSNGQIILQNKSNTQNIPHTQPSTSAIVQKQPPHIFEPQNQTNTKVALQNPPVIYQNQPVLNQFQASNQNIVHSQSRLNMSQIQPQPQQPIQTNIITPNTAFVPQVISNLNSSNTSQIPKQQVVSLPQENIIAHNNSLQYQQPVTLKNEDLNNHYQNHQQVINASQQKNIMLVGQQPSHIATNIEKTNTPEKRDARQYDDVDLSKGYPPQHYQNPVSARPPIIIRN